MEITKRSGFCYGHRLPKHPGRCRNLHGHSAVVEVSVIGEVYPETGMVVDFGDLKKAIHEVLDEYDHAMIVGPSESPKLIRLLEEEGWFCVFLPSEPTAEEIAASIKQDLEFKLSPLEIHVSMSETEDSWVTV